MKKFCDVCGKPSGMYPLCRDCFKLRDKGEVIKCEDCGKWHLISVPCACKNTVYTDLPTSGFNKCVICEEPTTGYAFCRNCYKKHTEIELLDILNNNFQHITKSNNDTSLKKKQDQNQKNNYIVKEISNCLICGAEANGNLFCKECYEKYKNKDILIQIRNCTELELLDEEYESTRKCKDGHIVKSKTEREIDNYLFDHKIFHAYERALPYGSGEDEVLKPDFCLLDYLGKDKHVYLEHWGYAEDNISYMQRKKFKMDIYKKLGITLVCTYEKRDTKDLETALDRKLNKQNIKEGQINGEEETNNNIARKLNFKND